MHDLGALLCGPSQHQSLAQMRDVVPGEIHKLTLLLAQQSATNSDEVDFALPSGGLGTAKAGHPLQSRSHFLFGTSSIKPFSLQSKG